jgi:hypothetical protein
MRSIIGIVLFAALGVAANAQNAAPRVVAEIAAGNEKIVKGSPFSAEAVSESVQVLADGNRITRSSTSKLYRNSEGRFRRESSGFSGTPFGTFPEIVPMTTIVDPVVGFRYLLNDGSKTVRALSLVPPVPPLPPGEYRTLVPGKVVDVEKLRTELRYATPPPAPAAPGAPAAPPSPPPAVALIAAARAAQPGEAFVFGAAAAGSTKTEDLGSRNIDGVEARGTRTVTTIEAGKIGNERPIEIVYEKWYSDELQMVVQSRHYDPRFGEQTYRLTNIVRSEPDPSLFTPPADYKVLTEPTTVYRTVRPKAAGERTAPTRTIILTPAAKP